MILATAGFLAAVVARLPALDRFPDTFFAPPSPPAVEYASKTADDPIARLNTALRDGDARLAFDDGGAGYLRSVLAALAVPIESQIAVFAKRSLQANIISPQNPRSIFFGDSVAVAWPRGGFIEAVAQDPNLGPVFYARSRGAQDSRSGFRRMAPRIAGGDRSASSIWSTDCCDIRAAT